MAAVSENDSSLANKCLALCQALNNQGKAFKFSLTISNTFSFSLDSRERTVPIPKAGKKRTSPSTRKRNARRRKQFLEKKSTRSSEENQADLVSIFPFPACNNVTMVIDETSVNAVLS